MTETDPRALSFGSDALAYDRHRPGYPDSVVDAVLSHADGPVSRALEVGAGTGKATVAFAGRGIEVVAVEPDEAMRSVLDDRVGDLPVRSIGATFESLDLDAVGQVDLLFAAAAFHWTDPATRWARAASALRPGGVLALFGAQVDLADEALDGTVDALTTGVLAPSGHAFPGAWTLDDLRAQPGLVDVIEVEIPRRVTMSAAAYVDHLSTVSAYRVLPADQQAALLDTIRSTVPEQVETVQDITLHLARRSVG